MTDLLEILKYVMPSLVVFATAYYFFTSFISKYSEKDKESNQILLKTIQVLISQEDKRHKNTLQAEQQKSITPVRLQAYERLILLLERISLPNLVMRINQAGIPAMQMQAQYIKTIREEFDHNLSQQVYISSKTWLAIKNAKEESIQKINLAASKIEDSADSMALSKKILEISGIENSKHNQAMELIKSEARSLF